MNLPIPSTTLISSTLIGGAARLAGRVGQAIGFDDVLRSDPGAGAEKLDQITAELVDAIEQQLGSLDVDVNPPLRVSVTEDGRLRIDGSTSAGG